MSVTQPSLFDPPTVAIVYNQDGSVYDACWSWETGQNYALHEGRRVVAVAADGGVSVEDAQALYDHEVALYKDCWGVE